MKIIMPIYLDEREAVWQSKQGARILIGQIARFTSLGLPVVVVTNLPVVQDLAREHGLLALLDTQPFDRPETFPPGSRRALEVAPTSHERIMLVDYRCPLIPTALILEAIHTARDHHGLVVSAVMLRDNPCQYCRHLDLADTGVLFLEDETVAPLPHLPACSVSKPFVHDWEHEGVATDGVFTRAPSLFGWEFHPAAVADNLADEETAPMLWIKEGTMARVAYRPWGPDAAGFCWVEEHNDLTIRLVRDADGGVTLVVHGADSLEESLHVVLIPFGKESLDWRTAHTLDLVGQENRLALGPPPQNVVGWSCMLLRDAHDDGYTVRAPFAPPNAPWTTDETMRRINKYNGAVIHGRQEFPTIYDIDGAFAVLPECGTLPDLDDPALQFAPIPLDPEQALRVETAFDMIIFSARERQVHARAG